VKAGNVLFDADRRIQIAAFSPIRLEISAVKPFSGEKLAATTAISAFGILFFQIPVGRRTIPPISAAAALPACVPEFVSRMIED
jgi:hypothetical protein